MIEKGRCTQIISISSLNLIWSKKTGRKDQSNFQFTFDPALLCFGVLLYVKDFVKKKHDFLIFSLPSRTAEVLKIHLSITKNQGESPNRVESL